MRARIFALSYIHGTQPSEQERLAALNGLTNETFVRFLDVRPGARVLEVGSGLGILAAAVAAAAPGSQVTGVEKSGEQLAAAVSAQGVTYVQGDAHALEFPDATFDLAYARYVLEHVADPERVLREMRRVVVPGGRVAVCENDIALVRFDPPCAAFERVWEAFGRYQATLGGDAFIGRRLYALCRAAGLSAIELSVQPEVHWAGSTGFVPWVRNIIGNLESARDGLVRSRKCSKADFDAATGELDALCGNADGSACFTWNRALAIR